VNPPCIHIQMMLCKRGILFLILCFLSFHVNSQVYFQKLYARSVNGISGVGEIKQTSTGHYIMAGNIFSCFSMCPSDGLLIKTDLNGDTIWARKMGGVREDGFGKVLETLDGNYLFIGKTTSFGQQATSNVYGEYIYIVETNPNGDTLWTKIYGGTNTDYAHNNDITDIKQTTDSGLIILAQVNSAPAGQGQKKDILVIRTNSTGDTLWTRSYWTNYTENPGTIIQTSDGGYLISGSTAVAPTYYCLNGFLVKLDVNGNIQWQKTYGGPVHDSFNGVEQSNSGDYIVAGSSNGFSGDSSQNYVYVLRLNGLGDTIWAKIYGPVFNNRFLRKIDDTTFLLVGLSGSSNFGILVLKINAVNGNILFSKEYGSPGSVNGVDVTVDGGFILGTWTVDFGSSYGEGYVIKADNSGNSGCYQYSITENVLSTQTITQPANLQMKHFPIYVNSTQTQISSGIVVGTICSSTGVEEKSNYTEVSVYPNPCSGILNIKIGTPSKSDIVQIINPVGEEVYKSEIKEGKLQIETGHLREGIYFLQISSKGFISAKKVIIQH